MGLEQSAQADYFCAMEEKNKGGRPTVMTEETVKKLERGFSMGLSITQACNYAGITRPTYYSYVDEHPEFSDNVAMLQETPLVKALSIIDDALHDTSDKEKAIKALDTAKWVLERRDDRFAKKQKVAAEVSTVGETREKFLADFLEDE